jgi:cytochrome c
MSARRLSIAAAIGLASIAVPGQGHATEARHGESPALLRPHGGSPEAGGRIVRELGCGACHRIPGVPGARGLVGPDLAGFARRSYIAGRLPNTPGNLEAWLRNPPAIDSRTAMPALGMDVRQVRDVASFLYELD